MVFKGFTDENGNVIPVQGAGMGYNEEKNSIAIGKGTVASSQDQFVFGRYNEEDTENGYVEVVGGGIASVSSSPSDNSTLEIVLGTGNRVIVELEPIQSLAAEGISWTQENGRYYYKILSRRPYVEGSDFYIGKNTQYYFIESDVPVEQLVSYENFENPAQNVENGKYFVVKWGEKNTNVMNGVWVYRGVESSAQTEVTRANIRTLDWEGNEKLAGRLTVGTGITIGETSLSEAQLIALKALLNT